MRDYLRSLLKVILELAAFAIGVAVLLLFTQEVGTKLGSTLLLVALVIIILILAAVRIRK